METTGNRPRVLICDDEQKQYLKLRKYLEEDGFECVDRVSGYEALALALDKAKKSRRWFQAVMIDVDLSKSGRDINGIQVYDKVVTDYPHEAYIIYTRNDADRFREEINRLRYRDVELVLLAEILNNRNIRLSLARLLQSDGHSRVFVVCGKHSAKNDALRKFLDVGLGLDVVDWEQAQEAAHGSTYTFEIVLTGIEMSTATVVLFTDDEEAKLREDLAEGMQREFGKSAVRRQSRPNVYIEAGFARGVRPKRTVFVEWADDREHFEGPTDFDGINLVRFDGGKETREALKRRLEAARCLLNPAPDWDTVDLGSTVLSSSKKAGIRKGSLRKP